MSEEDEKEVKYHLVEAFFRVGQIYPETLSIIDRELLAIKLEDMLEDVRKTVETRHGQEKQFEGESADDYLFRKAQCSWKWESMIP